MNDDKFSETIESIYAAALSDDLWEPALSNILDFLGRNNGSIQFMDLQTSEYKPLAFQGFDEIVFNDPLEILTIETDIFVQAVLDNPDETIIVGSRLIPQDKLHHSIFYNDIKRAYDLPYQDAMSGTSTDLVSSMGVAVVFDDEKNPFFTDEEIRKYSCLWPHVERAFHIRAAMADFRNQKHINTDLIEALDYAIIGLSDDNKVQFVNGKALELFGNDSPFNLMNNKIQLSGRERSLALQKALSNASGTSQPAIASQFSLPDDEYGRHWTVLISPAGKTDTSPVHDFSNHRISKFVKISDHSLSAQMRIETLRQPFQLTPTEVDLLTALLAGWSMARIAESKGRSVETLRSHLKSIFRKTGTNSQLELTRFVLGTPI